MKVDGEYTIDINVEYNYDYDASIEPTNDGYLLTIDEDFLEQSTIDVALITIAHEMIHLKQYEEVRIILNKYNNTVIWEDEEYPIKDAMTRSEYFALPWEVEAYGWENYYYEKYMEYVDSLSCLMELA